MATAAQLQEKIASLLEPLRRACAPDPLLSQLAELNRAALACLCQPEKLQAIQSGHATKLPGVRLQGIDRPETSVTALELTCQATELFAASLQLLSETTQDPQPLRVLAKQAADLRQELVPTIRQAEVYVHRETEILSQALRELRAETEAYRSWQTEFETERRATRGHAAQLRVQVEQERQRLKELAAQADSFHAELTRLQQAAGEYEALAGQVESQRRRLQELQREQAEFQQSHERLHLEIATAETELANLREELEHHSPEAEEFRKERQRLQQEIDEARQAGAQVAHMREELQSLKSQQQQDEQELQTLQANRDDWMARAAELREQLAATRHLSEASRLFDDPQNEQQLQQIRQIWEALPADAMDERLKSILEP